jgi:hypothetical protein
MKNRVFTDQELKEMGTRTLDLLTEAIESGDKDKAKQLAERMYQETLKMHDMYVDWTASFMDWIYKNYGDDALLQAEKKVFKDFIGKLPDLRKVPFRLRAQGTVNSLRGHQQPLKIVEDDEKICITMEPCGSGELLVQRGRYGPPCNLSMIQKPHIITGGKTDFPVYCTHEPVLELIAIEMFGYPITVCFPPEKVAREGGCRFCIYKNFNDIPEEFWTKVGKQKPKDL